tara:strand:- start:1209 stop:2612 length:1404 start_codon:yes stop_codon:yes gene_type:complete
MTTTYYDNSGYLTLMGDASTHDGTAGQPVDGIDFPHSGLIKLFDAQRYSYAILTQNVSTGTTSSIPDYNFNISMDDTTVSGKTTVAVKSGAIVRNGILHAVAALNLTEVATSATPSDIQFKEQGSSGENFYHVIVANNATPPVIKIRSTLKGSLSMAKDKVADIEEGDTPIAILRVQNGETKSNRHIQFLGTDRRDGSLSIYHNASNVPTEAMRIESSNTRTTFTNKIEDADIRFMLADNTASEKFEIYEDDGDTEVFSVNGLGTAEVKGTLIANSLNVGANAELQVTESSDNITFANTVNDKTLTFSVLDDGGSAKTASFTAVTHDNNIQLKGVEEVFIIAASDETTDLTTGNDKVLFHAPFAFHVTKVKATVSTAPTGRTLEVDIDRVRAGATRASILSTLISIDASEMTSLTASAPPVISTGNDSAGAALVQINTDDTIHINIDNVGSSAAGKGLKVTIFGYRT